MPYNVSVVVVSEPCC